MPVVLFERKKSRPATIALDTSASRGQLLFIAVGSTDDSAVHAACLAGLPITFQGMFFQKYSIDYQGGGRWYVESEYSFLQVKKPGESSYTFDTSAKTQHITISRATVDRGRVGGGAASDYKGLIGYTGESVDGVDVLVPTFGFTETHYLPVALVTAAYKLILFRMTARCNDDLWKGLERREALFMGAKGSLRGNDAWEISYTFAGEPNAVDVPLGNTGTLVPFKFGHDYLWFTTKQVKDAGSQKLIRVPDEWYTEQVYLEGDYGTLGVGV